MTRVLRKLDAEKINHFTVNSVLIRRVANSRALIADYDEIQMA